MPDEAHAKTIAALPAPFNAHFPHNPVKAKEWEPIIYRRALHRCVLVVANTRIEGAWSAYCSNVPGMDHDKEMAEVLRTGSKLEESLARKLFPTFEGVPYAR